MTGTGGHGAEGVRTAGCQRVYAAGHQEHKQGPGVGIVPRVLNQDHTHQPPQEVPAGNTQRRSSTSAAGMVVSNNTYYCEGVLNGKPNRRQEIYIYIYILDEYEYVALKINLFLIKTCPTVKH